MLRTATIAIGSTVPRSRRDHLVGLLAQWFFTPELKIIDVTDEPVVASIDDSVYIPGGREILWLIEHAQQHESAVYGALKRMVVIFPNKMRYQVEGMMVGYPNPAQPNLVRLIGNAQFCAAYLGMAPASVVPVEADVGFTFMMHEMNKAAAHMRN